MIHESHQSIGPSEGCPLGIFWFLRTIAYLGSLDLSRS